MLASLSDTNRRLGLHEEGISQVKEALEIYERLCDTSGQTRSLRVLAWSLYGSNQLDAAEEAVSRALDLSSNEGDQFQVSQCHYLHSLIYQSKDESEAAINHFEITLGIVSRFNYSQFWAHYSLAKLFADEGRFGDAYTHIEHSKSHAVNDAYDLGMGMAMYLYAGILCKQRRFEEAKSEVSCAAETLEKVGAARDLEGCRELLQRIREEMNNPVVAHEPDSDGELLETAPFPPPISSPLSGHEGPQMTYGIDVRLHVSVRGPSHCAIPVALYIPRFLSLSRIHSPVHAHYLTHIHYPTARCLKWADRSPFERCPRISTSPIIYYHADLSRWQLPQNLASRIL